MNKLLILIVLFCSINFQNNAQISEPGIPYSKQAVVSGSNYRVGNDIPAKTLPALDMVATNRALDSLNNLCKDCRLGYYGQNRTYDTDIIAEGIKDSIPSVGNVWRYQITSDQAKALQIHFSTFRIPPGAQLFLYSPDYAYVLGSFTKNNCSQSYTFNTQPIPGQTVILEYIEPFNPPYKGVIQTDYVTHNFIDVYDRSDGEGSINGEIGRSDYCEIDVACSLGSGWQNEAKSVGLLLNNDFANQYSSFCSSVLMNNAFQDGFPYLLTANHCAPSPTFNDFIVIFDFQTTGCGNRQLARPYLTNSISGSHTVIAKGDKFTSSDYTLLQLSSFIPNSYGVCYAGWDMDPTTGGYNSPYFVGIHHPNGDVKKISKSDHYLSVSDGLDDNGSPILDNQGVPYMTGQQIQKNWEIKWTSGITEKGSSGSPLFNANHKVVGQLRGGFSQCGVNKKDFYGKLSEAWNNGTYSTGIGNALGKGQIALKSMNTYCPATTPPPNTSANSVQVTDLYFKNGSGASKYENCQGSVKIDHEWIGTFTNNYDNLWTIISPASANFIGDIDANGKYTYSKTCPWLTAGIVFPANSTADYIDVVVQVTMTRNDNGNSSTMTKTLRLLRPAPAPTVSFPGSPANATAVNICSGSSVILQANTTGASPIYQWHNTTSGAIAGATNSTFSVSTAGTYYVSVTPAKCYSSSSTNRITATITITPVASFTPTGSVSACSNAPLSLTAATGAGFIYQWQKDNVPIVAATTNAYRVTSSGNYSLTVSSNSSCGNATTSPTTTVQINTAPIAIINEPYTLICAGGTKLLTTTTDVGTSYQWLTRWDAVIPGATNSTYLVTSTGIKIYDDAYKVKISNSSCSKISGTALVVIEPPVEAGVYPITSTTMCQGGRVSLNASSSFGTSLQWNNSSGPIIGATGSTYSTTKNTSDTYSITVTSGANCSLPKTSASIAVTVTNKTIIPPIIVPANGYTGSYCFGNYPSLTVLNYQTSSSLSSISSRWNLEGQTIMTAATGIPKLDAYFTWLPHFKENTNVLYTLEITDKATGCYAAADFVAYAGSFFINEPVTIPKKSIEIGKYYDFVIAVCSSLYRNENINLELSDANGSFNTPTIISTLRANTTSLDNHYLPSGIPLGQNYKVRLVSVNTHITSSAYDIAIVNCTSPAVTNVPCGVYTSASFAKLFFGKSVILAGTNASCSAGSTLVLKNTSNMTVIAEQNIILSKGFSAESGAVFSATIGLPCQSNPLREALVEQPQQLTEEILSPISVYPNPTSGQVNIRIPYSSQYAKIQIIIHDAIGNVVYEKSSDTLTDNEMPVDMNSHASGLYCITIYTDNNITNKKVIISK